MGKKNEKNPEVTENESPETSAEEQELQEPIEDEPGSEDQETTQGEGGEVTETDPDPAPAARKKPGPKPKADGFRAECYEKIEKGITHKTTMVVMKLRHRLANGKNVFPGDTFEAKEMDARTIKGAMDRYYIVPKEDVPEDGEKPHAWAFRMATKYEGDEATPLPSCKKKK